VKKDKKRTGLPDSLRMRHDDHFVELISSRYTGPTIRVIPTVKLVPNPQQARNELGNIKELMASVKEKGILEPLLVRAKGEKYEIIAGERRYIAAKNVGLKVIPCIEMDVEDNEALEIALIENLQRKDLGIFEEADGLKVLVDVYGYNHGQISEKIGKARSTITEVINLSKIPVDIREMCSEYNIKSRSVIIEVAKQKNKDDMIKLIKSIKERDLKREDTRDLSKRIIGKKVKREKNFVYNYVPEDKKFRLRLEFKEHDVNKNKIIRMLEEVIKKLRSGR
jgi:ParB family chromosome partitioning protein